MTKKITTLNIDENVLKLAKKEIPNMSGFVEDCLRAYLGFDNTFNIQPIQKELDNIKQASLNIHILTNKDYEEAIVENIDTGKRNKVWSKIWGLYRTSQTYNEADLTNASMELKTDKNILLEIMQTLTDYASKDDLIQCNDYNYAIMVYGQLESGEY